jgi:hypothetical protein
MASLRKIIREQVESLLICEIKIDIDDLKHRGFADQIGKIFQDSFADLNPVKITGKIGIKSVMGSGEDSSEFNILLANGDKIYVFRNTNPAFVRIKVNKEEPILVGSQEMFSDKLPNIAKKYYLASKSEKIKK